MRKTFYLKILVPLDGSDYANKALLHACALAKTTKAQLFLIYVVDKSLPLNLLDRKEYLGMLRRFGNSVLKKGGETAVKNGIESKQILREGNIVKEISKFAKNEKINLIIIGSKGLGGVARFFLGSVSSKLSENSPCSVLIVK